MEAVSPDAPIAYTAPEAGNDILGQVASAVCLLAPHLLLTAGYDADGSLLAIRYAHHNSDLPAWDAAAFEEAILAEPLLADPALLRGLFLADDRLLAVPDALYEPGAAADWLRRLYYVAPNETVVDTALPGRDLRLLVPFAQDLQEVTASYFGSPLVQPLSAALMQGTGISSVSLALAGSLATAVLYRGSRLLWHSVFSYDTPEDVAYRIQTACREHGILTKTVALNGYAATLTETRLLRDIQQYFPAAMQPADEGDWSVVAALMRQLRSCVS